MAEIINLRRRRKADRRAEAERAAELNRARFGRPKAERERDAAEKARAAEAHDGHKIEPED